MADIYRQANGSWNDGLWYAAATGGSSLGVPPAAGDVVYLNGRTIALDISTNALSALYAGVAASSTGAGNITCDVAGLTVRAATILAGTVALIVSNLNTPDVLTIVGNMTGGSGTNAYAARNGGTGIMNIDGSVVGGSATSVYGVHNTSTGTVTITGNVTGGSGSSATGVRNFSTGSITIGTVNSPVSINGGTSGSACGVYNNGAGGVIVIYGNVAGSASPAAYGVHNANTGTITITGNITGGGGINIYGVYNTSSGVVTLNNCNLINSTTAMAYSGLPPVLNNSEANYTQFGSVKYPMQLAANKILKGTVHGDRVGTLASDANGAGTGGGWTW